MPHLRNALTAAVVCVGFWAETQRRAVAQLPLNRAIASSMRGAH